LESLDRGPSRYGGALAAREFPPLLDTSLGLWRAPRIHGELPKVGIEVSERTVSRILRTVKRPPSQTWKTFLHNHIGEVVAFDFFTVPTIRLRILFVFLVIEHQRRKILHFGITEHPTAEWAAQQVGEAFADCEPSVI
jgi:putative transposase